ncbi:hypothetical protein D3OALGB2SA_154 [Olavius algarvensis associated proteobacterium Delta 3]|nr:hypothetical protein D3OALGB2SA_154 [Olavius algarvensis associated proteobacterium Delta 3]
MTFPGQFLYYRTIRSASSAGVAVFGLRSYPMNLIWIMPA